MNILLNIVCFLIAFGFVLNMFDVDIEKEGKGQVMNAEQMFKELGYEEKVVKGDEEYYKKYWKEEYWDEFYIVFSLKDKTFSPYLDCNGVEVPLDLSMDELKAINQQCKELGWIE